MRVWRSRASAWTPSEGSSVLPACGEGISSSLCLSVTMATEPYVSPTCTPVGQSLIELEMKVLLLYERRSSLKSVREFRQEILSNPSDGQVRNLPSSSGQADDAFPA